MTHRQEQNGKSWKDLPTELRHMIYGYLIDIDPQHRQLLNTLYEHQRNCIMHWAQKLCVNAAVPQSLASLCTIGAVSKTVRQNARRFYYASTDLRLYEDGITGLGFSGLLQKLGPGGTANLHSL